MERNLLIAILAGLAGMAGWGLADFFAKKTIDKVGDMATLAWAHVFGVVIIFALVVGRFLTDRPELRMPSRAEDVGILVFFGALQAAVYAFVYRAFGRGQLALLNPVFSSYSGFVVVVSVLAFGEVIGSLMLFCLAVVFAGILLINLDQASFALRRLKFLRIPGMKEILAAVGLAAAWTVLWGHFVIGRDWLSYAALMYLFMSVTILVLCRAQRVSLRVRDRTTFKFFLLIGIAEVAAYVGVSYGYSLTAHTSIVAVLSAAFSIPTVFLARAFLNERVTRLQLGGTALVIAGVVLVALA